MSNTDEAVRWFRQAAHDLATERATTVAGRYDWACRFHERGVFIRDLTDLPVEALFYTPGELDEMVLTGNTLIQAVLAEGRDLFGTKMA
jgi:hypothetical protein